MKLRLNIPMKLPSAANMREHWRPRWKRNKSQRGIVVMMFLGASARDFVRKAPRDSVIVTLSRVARQQLDDDNLAIAFKAIRDEVAKQIGMDDADKRLVWRYRQRPPEKGEPRPHVTIEVEAVALAEAS